MNILVSACLFGVHCRYDGKSCLDHQIKFLKRRHHLILVCPEVRGGLKTPREPAEKLNGRVVTAAGDDVTDEYQQGAQETLALARRFGCRYAVLKERSPSCGCGPIYDGSFTGRLIAGRGITAELLSRNGIRVIGESQAGILKNRPASRWKWQPAGRRKIVFRAPEYESQPPDAPPTNG